MLKKQYVTRQFITLCAGSTVSLLLLNSGLGIKRFQQPVWAAPEQNVSERIAQATTTSRRPLLRLGSRGESVAELQAALKLLGYYSGSVNSLYDESTVIAVSDFQRAAGIEVDGITGPGTWSRLFPAPTNLPVATQPSSSTSKPATTKPVTTKPATTKPATTKPTTTAQASPVESNSSQIDFPVLRKGMRGPAVRNLQRRLRSIGVYQGPIDGVFGADTQSAVRTLQRRNRLTADGVVGEATWGVLLR